MANTNTKNKKNSSSKWQKILKVVNPDSAKGRLIVFLVAFALVGGGIMAFRSFADPSIVNINAGWQKISVTHQPAQIVKETSGSKSNAVLWSVGPGGNITANTVLPQLVPGAPFNICASIKATASGTVGFGFGNDQHGGEAPISVTASSDYQEYCAPMTFLPIYGNSYNPGIYNNTTGDIRVGFIQLNYDAACYVSGSTTCNVAPSN